MVFASYAFLFGFLPAMVIAYALSPKRIRNLTLLVASYCFYGWWRPDFTLLLAFSTLVDFACGRKIGASRRKDIRRRWLVVSIVVNLGLLGYFKYANFGIDTLNSMLITLGAGPLKWVDVVLPVGISFITFQTMSYTIDVYRGEVQPENSILRFATYVALFPQLVAGPIVRYATVAEELKKRSLSVDMASFGACLFLIGLAKKVLLANNFGLAADEAFTSTDPGVLGAWIGLLSYTFQIYFDFSGYSDMAVGLGALLGFSFPRNFNGPYRSLSITEFWGRWHMTLSGWIRDYLYIPLGGNRASAVITYRNLIISMVLCGLWHGANWTFLIWGVYHGVWLLAERALGRRTPYSKSPRVIQNGLTFLVVMLGWCFFRATDLDHAVSYLGTMLGSSTRTFALDSYWTHSHFTIVMLVLGAAVTWLGKDSMAVSRERPVTVLTAALVLGAFSVSELLSHDFNPFLYFQF